MTATAANRNRIPAKSAVLTAVQVALPAGLAVVLAGALLIGVTGGRLRLDDPAGLLAWLSGWLTLCCLSAGLAAWLVASLANRRDLNRVLRVASLALLTKFLAVMLMPVVLSIWSAPTALSGGEMPCFHIDSACQAGLHGWDAIAALVAATISWYPLAIFVIVPGFADLLLVIPAAIWDKRVAAGTAAEGGYQRSV